MKNFGHTLIFGGTGMLKETTQWLIDRTTQTRIYGRKSKSLEQSNTTYRLLDYTDTDKLIEEITLAHKEGGPIHTVLAWIHNTAPNAIPIMNKQIEQLQNEPWTLYLVKGSSSDIESIKSSQQNYKDQCKLKIIQLGFKYNGTSSRWLTHEEISTGTIDSMQSARDFTIIGSLKPWEARP
ncbi:hypothetical protein [Cytobacillus kochii]|uniref:hypothetical protein n=1 Tax=Cytobacillus kochii TaxID=859143 RepID=UPI00402AD26C